MRIVSRCHKATSTTLLVGGAFLCLFLASCQTLKNFFNDEDQGVPLAEFDAKNGRYFPAFVRKFFPGANNYTQDYPTLLQARSELRMIQVKQLSDASLPSNEANLSWSADGVYLGFEIIQGEYRKIMLKDLVGDYSRELQLIPKGPSNFLEGMIVRSAQSYNAGLRWSRDSTRFAFMSNGGVGEYNIYIGAVGTKEKPITSSKAKDGYATWSPKTNELAFVSSRSGNGDIYVVELQSKKLTKLAGSPTVDLFPEWFPSGNRLVFCSGDALNHDLYLVERKNFDAPWSQPSRLTAWQNDDLRPTVSPDGKYVAFYSDSGKSSAENTGEVGKRWRIHVIAVEGAKSYGQAELEKTVIADDVMIDLNTGPAWSPDSQKIFYVKRDPSVANPIYGYDLFSGRSYMFKTDTRMNRDILMSKLGILSFRAQVGVWDRVFVALTNQGLQLQNQTRLTSKIHYLKL